MPDSAAEKVSRVVYYRFEWVARYSLDVRCWMEGHATKTPNWSETIAMAESDDDEGFEDRP